MKKYFTLIAIVILLLMSKNTYSQGERGVYLWPATFYEYGGIDKVMDVLKQNEITDIFLLVKGEGGYTLFPSEYSYKEFYKESVSKTKDTKFAGRYNFMTDSLIVEKIIDQAHKNKIKIHAWFIISGDKHYVETHPGSEVVQVPKPDSGKYPHPVIDKGHINLAYPPYKQYIFSLINKSLEYPFDGLMLDKIRYTSMTYSFDEVHISKALRAGVNIDKVIECASNTTYGDKDKKEQFFYKYRDGDKDLREWIKIKKEDIEEYVKEARKITKEKNILLSASFMPEGAYDQDFSDVHYAQNYKELSRYLDYIVIMSYPKSYHQPASWVKMVTANAKEKSSCKIWAAIQGFDSVSANFVFDQTKNARIANTDGIAIFRFGGMTPEMWSEFRNGMNVNIDKIKKSQIKGIIYSGSGTIMNCWNKSYEALQKSENIIPIMLREDELRDYKCFSDKKFILIPGGGGTSEAEALGVTALKNIEKFIASGGGYIGICAGSFLPVKGYNDITEKLQIVNAAPKDVAHWNRGSGEAKLEIVKKHPIFSDITGKEFELNYFNGPVLEPADLKLPPYIELAVFKTDYHENGAREGDMIGKTAILETKFKDGRIILFSPHPELTPGMEKLLINSANYVSKVKK